MSKPRWCPGVKGLTESHTTTYSNFYWRALRRVDGSKSLRINSTCKDCDKARVKRWRQDNPEKVSTYNKRWYWSDPDRRREINRIRGRIARGKYAWVWKKYRTDDYNQRVACGPFRQWLIEYVEPLCATPEEVAAASGEDKGEALGLVTFKWVHEMVGYDMSKIIQDKQKTMPLWVVDKAGALFEQMELTHELYPPEGVVAA